MRTSPEFCIFGAGTIGGTVAALLMRCGATVSVVARGQTLAALNSNGLRIMIGEEMLQAPIQVSEDPSEPGVQDDVIIVAKAPSLPDIARRIGPLLGPETAVVTAMNGMPRWFFLEARSVLAGHRLQAVDPHEMIARVILLTRVIGGVVYVSLPRAMNPVSCATIVVANFRCRDAQCRTHANNMSVQYAPRGAEPDKIVGHPRQSRRGWGSYCRFVSH
jgi:ketopantoate reductase